MSICVESDEIPVRGEAPPERFEGERVKGFEGERSTHEAPLFGLERLPWLRDTSTAPCEFRSSP